MASRTLPYFVDFSALYRRSEAISHAYRSGNLIFFLGSGASKAFHAGFPDWPTLLEEVLADTVTNTPEERHEIQTLVAGGEYLLAAEALKRFAVVDRPDRDEALDRKVAAVLDRQPLDAGDPVLHLAVLDFETPIVTTNYDVVLESVLRRFDLDGSVAVFDQEDEAVITRRLDPTEPPSQYVFKLHGSVRRGPLILDEGDYADFYFRARWPRALAFLRHLLATKMVVFVGFALSDPEIMPLLREATRYAGSYQHLAFLKHSEVPRIQEEVLRTHYRVDPILYQEHAELPLYVLEMRNFNPRTRLTLKLREKRDALHEAIARIRTAEGLSDDAAVVLFGSYAKYGELTSKEADVDLFFLSPDETESRTMRPSTAVEQLLGDRRIDVTIMARQAFEQLIRQGDAFASSILVTGSPIQDPRGIYGLIARGFRPQYEIRDLTANAYARCELRWLRLCAVRYADRIDYLRACQQWALCMMQLALIQRKPPASLLEASLLGNARHVIQEFVQRFGGSQEAFLLDLLRGAKGFPVERPPAWPDVTAAVDAFRSVIGHRSTPCERTLLWTRGAPLLEAIDRLTEVYRTVEEILENIAGYRGHEDSLPGEVEQELFDVLGAEDLRDVCSTFDWLLLFDLYDRATDQALYAYSPGFEDLIREAVSDWVEDHPAGA